MSTFKVPYTEDLLDEVAVDSNCYITDCTLDDEKLRHLFKTGSRIAAINGIEISGRGAMLNALLECSPNSVVEFAVEDDRREKIEIPGTVECDGTSAEMRVQPKIEEDEEALQISSRNFRSVTDSPKDESPFLAIRTSDSVDDLGAGIDKVTKGNCLIVICEGTNPSRSFAVLAQESGRHLRIMDLIGSKTAQRVTARDVAEAVIETLKDGSWFLLLHADKSLSALRSIETILQERREANLSGIHDQSRIIISTEAHPHFPTGLISGCVSLRVKMAPPQEQNLQDLSYHGSVSCRLLLRNSQVRSAATQQVKKKVQISSALQVVDIEARAIYSPSSQRYKLEQSIPKDATGSSQLLSTFVGLSQEKFLSIAPTTELGYVAVGSSLGNVYFLDQNGDLLDDMHAHEASVWDLCYTGPHEFATGCEDGSVVRWTTSKERRTMEATQAATGSGDIYAVRYWSKESILYFSGSMHGVTAVRRDGTHEGISTNTSGQALSLLEPEGILAVGGADGTARLFDCATSTCTRLLQNHTRKVPTLCLGENVLVTGSFDKTIQLYDLRSHHLTHSLRLKDYVTGLSLDDQLIAAAIGENLYVWDRRKMTEVYSGVSHAWSGLTRGILARAADKNVVTASVDGSVRFWKVR